MDVLIVDKGTEAIKICPFPFSVEELRAECRRKFRKFELESVFWYEDADGDHVRICENADLKEVSELQERKVYVRAPSSTEKIHFKSMAPPPVIRTAFSEVAPCIEDEGLFNYTFLSQFRDNELTVKAEFFKYNAPTAFFFRVTQHIVHLATRTGPKKTAEFFKLPLPVIKFLMSKADPCLLEYPYSPPHTLISDLPTKDEQLSPKICKAAVVELKNGRTTVEELMRRFEVPSATLLKWISIFEEAPGKRYLTEEYYYSPQFRRMVITDYLLDRYSAEDFSELYGIKEKMIHYWIYCETHPELYQLEEVDYDTIQTETKVEVCRLISEGTLRVKDIVNKLGVRPNTVHKWLQIYQTGQKFCSHPRRQTASNTLRKAYFLFKELCKTKEIKT